jgi:hypothetical protein
MRALYVPCRFAPISAEWLGGTGRRDADRALTEGHSAHWEEQQQLAAMMQASSVLDIEAERVRALEKGAGSEFPGSLEADGGDERSHQYLRTTAQSSAQLPLFPAHSLPTTRTQSMDLETGSMGLSLSSRRSAVTPVTSTLTVSTGVGACVGAGASQADPLEYIRAQMLEQVRFLVAILWLISARQ